MAGMGRELFLARKSIVKPTERAIEHLGELV
jgi:hypothetical protein